MTDFIDNLLTSMSSKFNETNADLQINLNEDKTLKWRGLHNNQYAAVKKRKDIKRSEKSTTSNTTSTDDPPLMSDSASVTVSADDVVTADVTQCHEADSVVASCTISSEKSETNHSTAGNDTKSVSADKMEKINIDKEKDDDQRPFRRTLRRKQNADDANDDVGNLDKNRKVGLRPKRYSSAGSTSENRSVSPRGEKDDKLTNEMTTNRNIVTRQRGRAKKHDRDSSVEVQSKHTADESNESLPKTRNERKSSIANEVDDGLGAQPSPPKLRRSERMHTSTPCDQKDPIIHIQSDDRAKSEADAAETKLTDKEHITRSRKRTLDDKKSQDCTDLKDDLCVDDKVVPSEMDVDVREEAEAKTEPKCENSQKSDDVEIIEAVQETNNDDQFPNGSETNVVIVRKRGRKPGFTKAKANLKLSMTIATRNTPMKKSPRFTSDESPFVYTIPKKDKASAEQVN